ncbi:hypothetical protein [Litoribaculum gwangyangense]|uniref:Uncharacterized protein n=1 Tax=Litoribaculum gwangyangense TaxID=1130722 RepID=A0ABP9C0Z4_9FLAO
MSTDFRLIPIINSYSEFYKENVYKVPCKVLSVGNRLRGKVFSIDIEILDFVSGELVMVKAKTYEGSLSFFQNLPITTFCVVRKLGYRHFDLIVYGHYIVGIMEAFYGLDEILNHDEDEIFRLYNDNYQPLRQWLGISTLENNDIEDYEDDLPF